MVDIELLSTGWTSSGSSALDRLEEIAKESIWVKGVMAFFTHGDEEPLANKKKLMERLKASESYLCVGWNKPTNFDKISKLSNIGVSFFVNVAKVARSPKIIEKINTSLMHSKLLLFKLKDNKGYTIVIGSHNWTNKAMIGDKKKGVSGINIEDSIIIKCTENHDLVETCKERIEHIKNQCLEYNSTIHDSLRSLQDSDETMKRLVYDGDTVRNSPKKLYISFTTESGATQLKQGTRGVLFNNKNELVARFVSQGSWSSGDVKIDSIERYIAPWDNSAALKFDLFQAGKPSPTDHLAEIVVDYLGNKHKAKFRDASKKTDRWKKIKPTPIKFHLSDEQGLNLNVRHWKALNGEPDPHPYDLLPDSDQTSLDSIKQLQAYVVTFIPPLDDDDN